MSLSPDGRYVFTLRERLQEHHAMPPPGQIANDDDASFVEQVITIYDSSTGRFLNGPVSTFLPGVTGYQLLPSSEPESFEILEFDPSIRLLRYRIAGGGAQNGVALSELEAPKSDAQVIRDPANARTLLVRTDGMVIEVAARLRQIGAVIPLAPGRRMYSPALSGDGKLLFIPTGPTKNTAVRFAPFFYIDQIDVYEASGLTRLRSLRSQRPLLEVVPNQDGSILYAAIPDRRSVVVLNSESLWQEEEHLTESAIHHIVLLP